MLIYYGKKVFIYGMEMVLKNFYKKEIYLIENGIQDQSTDFNGEILELNIKIVIAITKIKALINYKMLLNSYKKIHLVEDIL